jgi:hypothetical protein
MSQHSAPTQTKKGIDTQKVGDVMIHLNELVQDDPLPNTHSVHLT